MQFCISSGHAFQTDVKPSSRLSHGSSSSSFASRRMYEPKETDRPLVNLPKYN